MICKHNILEFYIPVNVVIWCPQGHALTQDTRLPSSVVKSLRRRLSFIVPPVVYFSNMLLNKDWDSKEISTNIAHMPFSVPPLVYFTNMPSYIALNSKELSTNIACTPFYPTASSVFL